MKRKVGHAVAVVVALAAAGANVACSSPGVSQDGSGDGNAFDSVVPGDAGIDTPTADVADGVHRADGIVIPDAGFSHCASAADCDDTFGCTDDTCCDGVCVHHVLPMGCGAGSYRDLRRGCVAGHACASGSDCMSTDPCLVNGRCDPAARACLFDMLDGDNDHYPPRICGGSDCDDSNPNVHPGNDFDPMGTGNYHCTGIEAACNGIDDNCNGVIDEGYGLTSDLHHCGTCGRDRATSYGPDYACVGWTCTCSVPTVCGFCGLDLMTSDTNCGRCGNRCPRGVACVGGACQCPAGMTVCAPDGGTAACVDLLSNSANCGSCGHACPTGVGCVHGSCGCPAGQTACPDG